MCDYNNVYKVVKGTVTIPNTTAAGALANNTNKLLITKNCAPFSDWLSKINNTQVHNAKDIDVVMPISRI